MKQNSSWRILLMLVLAGAWLSLSALPPAPALSAPAQPQALSSAAASVPGARFVQVASSANIAGNSTFIDHPLANGNPDAILLVSQNRNPGGGLGGVYNDTPVGVWYSNSLGQWAIFNQDLAAMPEGASFNVLVVDSAAGAFVHTATAGNIAGDGTVIDNPATNGQPDALVLVTQNWNPGGVGGTYNNHPVGVWYNGGTDKWIVFNEDLAGMPVAASFNVLVIPGGADTFTLPATTANTILGTTYIDQPLTNGNPNAILFVTQNWNPGGGGGTYNAHPVGVWYDELEKKWAVFNQDLADIPEGADFNVHVARTRAASYRLVATAANSAGNTTYLDQPLTNSDPNAILFATSAPGAASNNHPIGLWYNSLLEQWAVFNQDLADVPEGAAFDLFLPPADTSVFVHLARASTNAGDYTLIDHPLTNGNPDAVVFATQNWNPSGVGSIYNNHPIGVWYSSGAGKWSVFNEDLATMTEDAAFNIMVRPAGGEIFVHTADAGNIASNSSRIDSPLTDGNPNARLLVTQNWNPGGGVGTYNNSPIGTWYDEATGKWWIYNEDASAMPEGAAFNVMVTTQTVLIPLLQR